MKKKLLLILFALIVVAMPASAAKWDYVLNDSTSNNQKVTKEYLNDFHKNLKGTWYSPTYRRIYANDVEFYLNSDGTVSNVRSYKGFIAKRNYDPYSKIFEKHIDEFFAEYRFKPFPKEIKQQKIRMGYTLTGNYTPYYNAFGAGGVVYYGGQKMYDAIEHGKAKLHYP